MAGIKRTYQDFFTETENFMRRVEATGLFKEPMVPAATAMPAQNLQEALNNIQIRSMKTHDRVVTQKNYNAVFPLKEMKRLV